MLFTAALVFTGCSNGSDTSGGGGGTPPTPPVPGSFAVNFSVDGGNGTLKAKADGIPETDVSPITVEQGKTVTFTAVPAANYKVKEWKVDGAVVAGNTSSSYIHTVTKAAEVKVSFEALPPGEASYTVKHYREKTDGTYPAEPTDSETLNGTAGDSVAFMPKTGGDYEGFTYNSALTMVNGAIQTSGPIQADGSTVVELYYERKTVNVTFKLAGGNVAGDIADVVKTGKYGTALSAPVPVQTGFSFTGWHPVLPATPVFPASDKTYTAQWAQFQFKIDFGVDGGHGTLKAEVGGSAIHSGDMVEHGETVIFIAVPADTNYAVDKWTNNGTVIAGAGANINYHHTVTADANIKVKFTYSGPALAVNQQTFTGTVGDTLPVYKLVTAGSGDYTARPENPSVISVNLNNTTGNVTVQCIGEGSSRIKVKDNMSGLEAYSGTVTVQALVTIPDDFIADGIHYEVVDKTNKHVHIHYKAGGFGANVHIPATVTFNGETYTITGCTVSCLQVNFEETTAFTVDSANAFLCADDGVLFNKDKTRLIKYPKKKTDASYTVPDSVKTIGRYAFYMIENNLTTLNLPEGKALTTVEDQGISYCTLLADVNIPSTLRNLGEEFLYWTGITGAVVIPEGIESLKAYSFAWCPNLTRVELPASFKSSADIFFNCPALTEVTCKAVTPPSVHGFDAGTPAASCTLKVPAGSISKYETAPIWKNFKKPFVGL
ncbi:leucine-rich repeat domain-containing protein [Treponema sp. SP13]|uniref:leucine-rich repeat domain-containing protein n=1 Tax=Treponema sp. SP13 TaxID=2789742 RepID=UPI003D9460C8